MEKGGDDIHGELLGAGPFDVVSLWILSSLSASTDGAASCTFPTLPLWACFTS